MIGLYVCVCVCMCTCDKSVDFLRFPVLCVFRPFWVCLVKKKKSKSSFFFLLCRAAKYLVESGIGGSHFLSFSFFSH